MRFLAGPVAPVLMASVASLSGCQLLYEKNDLTVASGGSGGTSVTTIEGGGGAGAATSSGTTSAGGSHSTTTEGGGGTTSTTEGGGGTGGTSTTTSEGGAGGATTTGEGGAGGTTTSTTTEECTEPLFVLGTSATSVVCATYDPAGGTWSTSASAAGHSNVRPTATLLNTQKGVGVFYQEDGATGPLRAVEWTSGACGAPVDVRAVVTKAAPSAAALEGKAHVLFQGTLAEGADNPFHRVWDPAGGWMTGAQVGTDDSVAVSGIARSGTELLAVHSRVGDSALTRTLYTGGAWVTGDPAGGAEDCFKTQQNTCELSKNHLTPGVTALDGGGWLVVFHDFSNTMLRWLTTNGKTSTPSALVPMATSPHEVALASIPGGAVLGFRGENDMVYASVFSAGAWGVPAQVGAEATSASPAVARGVCTHDAELVYIDGAGGVKHASLEGGTWSVPVAVGAATGMKGVGIAAPP